MVRALIEKGARINTRNKVRINYTRFRRHLAVLFRFASRWLGAHRLFVRFSAAAFAHPAALGC